MSKQIDVKRANVFIQAVYAYLLAQQAKKVGMCSGKVEQGGPVQIKVAGLPVEVK
jgi:hypothetical protein